MFFPWDVDGETHPAWGTAGLAVANLAVAILARCVQPFFGIFDGVLGGADSLILRYDEFKPWTWITSAFLHANLAHLAINMLFLLTFGRIVEARAGTGRFLLLSLALIATQGLIENVLFAGARSGSYGASGLVFALIAVAFLWAPRQRVRTQLIYLPWVQSHEFQTQHIGSWYIGWSVLDSFFLGIMPSSQLLHLLGAVVGGAAGWWMLRKGLVDCDGEDWLSIRRTENAAYLDLGEAPDRPSTHLPPTATDHVRSYLHNLLLLAGGVLVASGLVLLFNGFMDLTQVETEGGAAWRVLGGFVLGGAGVRTFTAWRDL
ncbi:MAG: rhomboid family intramembrane serine protease [Planctomycetota bacterium]